MIPIFLADSNQLLLDSLPSTLLQHEVQVVGVCRLSEELATNFLASTASILLTDICSDELSWADCLDQCRQILKGRPSVQIVMYSSQFADTWLIEKAYRAGITHFIKKDEPTHVLVEALRYAMEGKEYFSPGVAQALAWNSIKNPHPSRILDNKEMQLFLLVADGHSITECARTLGLSYNTVSSLLKIVKAKLRIQNLADFTKLAIKYGLISEEVQYER